MAYSAVKLFFVHIQGKNVPSVGANSLDVFISSLDEELEIGTPTQLAKFFTLQKCLRPKSLFISCCILHWCIIDLLYIVKAYLGKNSVKSAPCMKANSTRRKKTVSRT